MKPLLFLLAFFLCHPVQALILTGGGNVGTRSQGIALANDGVNYVFITPRHFLHSHANAPTSFGSGTMADPTILVSTTPGSSNFLLSSPTSSPADRELQISELASNLTGITPLPVLAAAGSFSSYLNLPLRVFGYTPGSTLYGYQNTGPATSYTVNNDATGGGAPVTINLFDNLAESPADVFLFVDIRDQTNPPPVTTAFLASGDSNGGLVAELPDGTLAAVGAALGVLDIQNPLTGGSNAEVNVYNFAGSYRNQINSYLASRSSVLGTTYQASFVVVPEPSRGLLMLLTCVGWLGRRKRR